MKIISNKYLLALLILLLASNNVVATPKLSGNYIFSFSKTCQATIVPDRTGQGDISASLFQVKITPNSTGFAGTALVSGYNDVGSNLLIGSDIKHIFSDSLTENVMNKLAVTYYNTATTLYLSKINQIFHVYYGNIDSSNVAHYAAIINMSNDSNVYDVGIVNINKCVTQGTFMRQ